MLVIGDREAAEGTVSVRSRSGGDLGARGRWRFVRCGDPAKGSGRGTAACLKPLAGCRLTERRCVTAQL